MREAGIQGEPVHCGCGKLLAYERDGKIFVWCRGCRKEVELKIQSGEIKNQGAAKNHRL